MPENKSYSDTCSCTGQNAKKKQGVPGGAQNCGYDDDHSNEVINGDGILWRGISCDDDGVI